MELIRAIDQILNTLLNSRWNPITIHFPRPVVLFNKGSKAMKLSNSIVRSACIAN